MRESFAKLYYFCYSSSLSSLKPNLPGHIFGAINVQIYRNIVIHEHIIFIHTALSLFTNPVTSLLPHALIILIIMDIQYIDIYYITCVKHTHIY